MGGRTRHAGRVALVVALEVRWLESGRRPVKGVATPEVPCVLS